MACDLKLSISELLPNIELNANAEALVPPIPIVQSYTASPECCIITKSIIF